MFMSYRPSFTRCCGSFVVRFSFVSHESSSSSTLRLRRVASPKVDPPPVLCLRCCVSSLRCSWPPLSPSTLDGSLNPADSPPASFPLIMASALVPYGGGLVGRRYLLTWRVEESTLRRYHGAVTAFLTWRGGG